MAEIVPPAPMPWPKAKFTPASSCEGKYPYRSMKEASKAARHKKGTHPYEISAYKCPFCPSFHFGHAIGASRSHHKIHKRRYEPEQDLTRLRKQFIG